VCEELVSGEFQKSPPQAPFLVVVGGFTKNWVFFLSFFFFSLGPPVFFGGGFFLGLGDVPMEIFSCFGN